MNSEVDISKFEGDGVERPKVSICVVTYNQENFVEQCLLSLVEQDVDFPYEIIVSDDCSTDNTVGVIRKIAEKYQVVKLIEQKNNLGPSRNFLYVHSLARGEYVAHMDGDDYALPGKIKAQANYLDNNKACNVVFHRVFVDFGVKGRFEDLINFSKMPKNGFTRSELIRHICVGVNSSKMYRRVEVEKYPDFDIVDYFETVMQVGDGFANYVDDRIYGVYRAGIGIASSGLKTRNAICESLEYFGDKFRGEKNNIATAALLMFLVDFKNGRKTWVRFFRIWIGRFSLTSIYLLCKDVKIVRMLRLPMPNAF